MDANTALRGPNASAGPFASSTANATRPRFRSIQPLSLTSSDQYESSRNQNTRITPRLPRPDRFIGIPFIPTIVKRTFGSGLRRSLNTRSPVFVFPPIESRRMPLRGTEIRSVSIELVPPLFYGPPVCAPLFLRSY